MTKTTTSQPKSIYYLIAFFIGGFFFIGALYFGGLIHFYSQDIDSCDNSQRYDLPTVGVGSSITDIGQINANVANFYNQIYQTPLSYDPNTLIDLTQNNNERVGSAFISKKMMDHIFANDLTSNGVRCYFGWNGLDINLFLMPDRHEDFEFQPSVENFYMINTYCPPRCIVDRSNVPTIVEPTNANPTPN
jgi:hypothetical protein